MKIEKILLESLLEVLNDSDDQNSDFQISGTEVGWFGGGSDS